MEKDLKKVIEDLSFGETLTLDFKLNHEDVSAELVSVEVNKEDNGKREHV